MAYALPNTHTDPVYDVRLLIQRAQRGRDVVCCRQRSIEVALELAKQGALVCWWEGRDLIARLPKYPPIRPFGPSLGGGAA